jgi:hypothetical protein
VKLTGADITYVATRFADRDGQMETLAARCDALETLLEHVCNALTPEQRASIYRRINGSMAHWSHKLREDFET